MGIFGQGLGGIWNVLGRSAAVPVRADGRGVHPRARPFPGRPLVRREDQGLFHRLRREIFGFYDRLRHPLAHSLGSRSAAMSSSSTTRTAPACPPRQPWSSMTPDEQAGAFQTKSLAARSAIVAAGPIANFLLAIVIFAVTFTFVGMQVTAPRVDELVPEGVAASAGFKPGDVIVSIDGQSIETFADMQRIVSGSADRELTFEVNRGGALLTLKVTPARREISDRFGNKMRVGRDRHPPQPDPDRVGVQALRAHRSDGAGRAGDVLHRLAHAVLSRRCHYGTGVRRPDAGARSASPRSQGRSPASASCRCST